MSAPLAVNKPLFKTSDISLFGKWQWRLPPVPIHIEKPFAGLGAGFALTHHWDASLQVQRYHLFEEKKKLASAGLTYHFN